VAVGDVAKMKKKGVSVTDEKKAKMGTNKRCTERQNREFLIELYRGRLISSFEEKFSLFSRSFPQLPFQLAVRSVPLNNKLLAFVPSVILLSYSAPPFVGSWFLPASH